MRAKREITSALAERYRSSGRLEKGRILDELCAVTGWHRKHAVRPPEAAVLTYAAYVCPCVDVKFTIPTDPLIKRHASVIDLSE